MLVHPDFFLAAGSAWRSYRIATCNCKPVTRCCRPSLGNRIPIVSWLLLLLALLLAWPTLSYAAVDGLMDAPIPIVYGEEGFRQRIEARTGGEREAVGLVLSGGSARAFAHIGVLTRMEEAGIVPDFIVANSMGSIIGL
jgi:hypothetical protein